MTEFNKIYTTTTGRYEVNTSKIGANNEATLDKLAKAGPIDHAAFLGIVQPFKGSGAYRLESKGNGMPAVGNEPQESPDLSNVEADSQSVLMMLGMMAIDQEKTQNKLRNEQRNKKMDLAKEEKQKADAAAKKDFDAKMTKAGGDLAAGAMQAAGGGVGAMKTVSSAKAGLRSSKLNDDLIAHKQNAFARHENPAIATTARRDIHAKKVDDLDIEIADLKTQKYAAARAANDSGPRGVNPNPAVNAQKRTEIDDLDEQISLKTLQKRDAQDNVNKEDNNLAILENHRNSPAAKKQQHDDDMAERKLTKQASDAHQAGERDLAMARVAAPLTQAGSSGATAGASMDAAGTSYDADLLRNEKDLIHAESDQTASRMQDYEAGANALGKSASDAASAVSAMEASRADHAKQAANRF